MARRLALTSAAAVAVAGATFALQALWERPFADADPAPGIPAPAAAPPTAPVPAVAPAPSGGPSNDATRSIASAAAAISPSVVQLLVEAQAAPRSPFEGPSEVSGSGSGVVFRPDGYIVTNYHVVENARRIEVRLRDGRRYVGTLVGADRAIDLAVVKVEAADLVAARFASSDAARPGQWVVAVGAPFGLDYTVTAGVISATGRANLGANEIEDYLQTDASINPGNSGGPLVDLEGQVLGINTMILGRGSGIGFAIPSDLARHVANQLVTQGRVHRAWIGVSFQEMTPELAAYFAPSERRGALINSVAPESPAARAGIREGDVIVSIGGSPVADGHDLLRHLLRRAVGEALEVGFLRGGRAEMRTLTTGERPSADPPIVAAPAPNPGRGIGLSLEVLDPFVRQRLRYTGPGTLVIRQVGQGSAADRAGLRPGDVLVTVDRVPVTTVDDVRTQLADGRGLFDVGRGAGRYFTVLATDP